jgi:catechol 2,3-dioxygenase-like lactoylglutathione lyase family enzyme
MHDQRRRLGSVSVSLTVKDIAASRVFYEKLGFGVFHDAAEQGWMILRNESATIGLFQGMFERNILTFNPGWDTDGQPLEDYTDVRDLQRELEARGLEPTMRAEEGTTGPASCMIVDPDGNPILIDQHV